MRPFKFILKYLSLTNFYRITTVWIPNIILSGILVFVFIKSVMPKADIGSILNYSALILLGMSAVAFSWSSTLQAEDGTVKNQVNTCAEKIFHSAILFVIVAAFDFTLTNIQFVPFMWLQPTLKIIIPVTKALCSSVATLKAIAGLTSLNKILFDRVGHIL